MTPNTSPKKPDWFALIEKDAPSAQVRKVDKKIPAATAFMALAIAAAGTFFANGSLAFDSSPTSNTASTSMSTVASGEVAQTTTAATSAATSTAKQTSTQKVQSVSTVKNAKVAAPQSAKGIANPTLNGGGDDDDEDDDDDRD
jgi:hypothetical protein